jgi:hypothetical protein
MDSKTIPTFSGEFFNDARIDFVLSQNDVNRVLAFSLPLQVHPFPFPLNHFLIIFLVLFELFNG